MFSRTPNKRTAVHCQITAELRRAVHQGEFAPGERLPSMHELARRFNTSYFTVQHALTPLVQEGLLERKRRVGTTVKRRSTLLTVLGIYCSDDFLGDPDKAFYRQLYTELTTQLAAQGVEARLFVDTRPGRNCGHPLSVLLQATERRTLQAVIAPLCDPVSVPWLCALPVPTAFVTGEGTTNRTAFDPCQALQLGLERLGATGCRRAGLISTLHLQERSAAERAQGRVYREFAAMAGALGLAVDPQWCHVPRQWQPVHESYGYEGFKSIWEQPERPQGLVVYPDVVARGVVAAVLELGVRVPEQLKLVLHRNRGVEWICPLAVDWVESDVAACAASLITQVTRQLQGKTNKAVVLPHRLVMSGQAEIKQPEETERPGVRI